MVETFCSIVFICLVGYVQEFTFLKLLVPSLPLESEHAAVYSSLRMEDYWLQPGEHVFIRRTADPRAVENGENRKTTLFRIHTKNVLMSVQANLISIFDTAIELLPEEKLLYFSLVVTVKKEETQHMVP